MKNLFLKFPAAMLIMALSCGIFFACEPEVIPEKETEEENTGNEGTGSGGSEGETPGGETEDKTPVFTVSLAEAGPTYADVNITAKNLFKAAYRVYKEPKENLRPAAVFANGTELTIPENGEGVVRITTVEMAPKTDYYVYFAAQDTETSYFTDVLEVAFTTTDYSFDEMLTVVETYYDGFKVHVTVPEEVKARKNALRYNITSMPMYYVMKYEYDNFDFDMLLTNGGGNDAKFLTDNATLVFNNDNINETYWDPFNNVYVEGLNHYPICPGEPAIVFAGEFKYNDTDNIYGWGAGYLEWMYDLEGAIEGSAPPADRPDNGVLDLADDDDNYWTGRFSRILFETKKPEKLDGKLNIKVEETTPINALFTITPDKDIEQYAYAVIDHGLYLYLVDKYLFGHEEYLQWFMTSYFAQMDGIANQDRGNNEIQVFGGPIQTPLNSSSVYHIIATGVSGEYLEKQTYEHVTFETAPKTLAAPVITVTPVESDDPFYVKFNIKATSGKAWMGSYACNYERDWKTAINGGNTYADMVAQGWSFSSAEIAEINSAAGYTMAFPTVDGETTVLAVQCVNEENTANSLANDSPAIARATSPVQPYEVKNNSPLFASLPGDWTAKATVKVIAKDDSGQSFTTTIPYESKITIAYDLDVPTLTQDVISLYPSEGAARAYYEQFKEQNQNFVEARMQYRNRLLCMGWIDYDPGYNRLATYTPWDLFTSPEYSCIDVAQIFYEFGPKWYLDVDEKGNVTVPVDANFMAPFSQWQGYPYYLTAYSETTNAAFSSLGDAGFPVEVSADNNKITVKPVWLKTSKDNNGYHRIEEVVAEGTPGAEPYYPNAVGSKSGTTQIHNIVLSDLVLTRGWNSKSNAAAGMKPVKAEVKASDADGNPVETEKVVVRSHTDFKNMKKVERKKTTVSVMNKETLDERVRQFAAEFKKNRK